jgi:hypothetical protein
MCGFGIFIFRSRPVAARNQALKTNWRQIAGRASPSKPQPAKRHMPNCRLRACSRAATQPSSDMCSRSIRRAALDLRGIRGGYQHCNEKNRHRHLAEFEFRYNTCKMTDSESAVLAVKGGEGKRLTHRRHH